MSKQRMYETNSVAFRVSCIPIDIITDVSAQ